MAAKIKKGDKVVVVSGRDKGRNGEVVRVMPRELRARNHMKIISLAPEVL